MGENKLKKIIEFLRSFVLPVHVCYNKLETMNFMSWLSRILGCVPVEERRGISLGQAARWNVSCVKDFPSFLRALGDLVPPGSILYLEGASPTEEIRSFLEERAAGETAKLAMGTIWPRPECFHVQITGENLEGLAELAGRHATPEVAVHLHVYKNTVLLEWYDAFYAPFCISKEIPEGRVREFCARLGTKYEEEAEGV